MTNDNLPSSDKDRSGRENFLGISVICIIIFALWMATWVGFSAYFENRFEERGTFGDMFGALNALFSGFGLAGIVYAIILQRRDLHMQRDELKETRKEFAQQNETMERQRFENTFFHLIDLLHEIVGSLHHSRFNGKQSFEKREVFREAYSDLIKSLNAARSYSTRNSLGELVFFPKSDMTESDELTYLIEGYITFYNNYSDSIGHYFRHLYHIFKYIFKSNLTDEEKKFYASLIRAQLSQTELCLILYNSLISGLGRPKFLFLIKEFDILHTFHFSALPLPLHKKFFTDALLEIENPYNDPPNQFLP